MTNLESRIINITLVDENVMIEPYQNKHHEDRVFIIGNGPSLAHTPLEKLNDEITIAMNKINLIFEDTSWRPTYYIFYDIAYDPTHEDIADAKQAIKEAKKSFIPRSGQESFEEMTDIEYFVANNLSQDLRHEDLKVKQKAIQTEKIDQIWSSDCSKQINNFGSTMSAAAQLAIYMGFNEIYFLGTDLYQESYNPGFTSCMNPKKYDFNDSSTLSNIFDYAYEADYTVKSLINLIVYGINKKLLLPLGINAPNQHFSSDYTDNYIPVDKLNKNLKETHRVIKIASDKYDFDVYNATLGGNLEVYERVDLNKII